MSSGIYHESKLVQRFTPFREKQLNRHCEFRKYYAPKTIWFESKLRSDFGGFRNMNKEAQKGGLIWSPFCL
jgi:hypothetical protein